MRGEFIAVWAEMWQEVWIPLIDQPLGEDEDDVPEDIFCELYREVAAALKAQPSIKVLADVIDDPVQSRDAFEMTAADDLTDERAVVTFLEAAHQALDDLGGDELTNRYFNLLSSFINKFSLRYDLRRPCILCPTLPGIFASLVRDLWVLTNQDTHLDMLMKDFEDAFRDLRYGRSESRIKTCIQKQINLLEAIAGASTGTTGSTLGDICNKVDTWPHETLKQAMKKLYGFASNYPGIRHSGTPASVLRAVDMRDMVAMSILLTGFTPYLESRLSADEIFGGGVIHAGPFPPVAMLADAPVHSSDTVSKSGETPGAPCFLEA